MATPPGFEDWYRELRPRLVRSLVVACNCSSDVAAEAADEALARALESWPRVQAMATPAGWTHKVALNLVRRRFRRRKTEQQGLERLAVPLSPAAGPGGVGESVDLWRAVGRLDRRERDAVALRYVADLSEADVAAALGLSVGTASSLLSRARRQLRVALDDRDLEYEQPVRP